MRRQARQRRPQYTEHTISSARAAFLSLGPYSWIEAGSATIDGVTGKCGSMPDLVAAGTGIRAITANHAWTQSTGANQCAAPTPFSALNGRLAMSFAGGQYYTSSSTGAAWKFLHDGTGAESFYAFIYRSGGTTNLLQAGVNAATDKGISTYFSNTGQYGYIIYNGSGTPAYDTGAIAAGLSAGTAYKISLRHATASTPKAEVYRGSTQIASGSPTSPSSANASFPPVLGATITVSLFANMDFAFAAHFNRVLSSVERSVVSAYLATFGV